MAGGRARRVCLRMRAVGERAPDGVDLRPDVAEMTDSCRGRMLCLPDIGDVRCPDEYRLKESYPSGAGRWSPVLPIEISGLGLDAYRYWP